MEGTPRKACLFFVAKNMVSSELLAELKIILQEEFGVVLDQQDLSEFGNMLVQMFAILSDKTKNREGVSL